MTRVDAFLEAFPYDVVYNHEIGLLGLGHYGDAEEDLLYLFPTTSGRIRLTPLLDVELYEEEEQHHPDDAGKPGAEKLCAMSRIE